MNINQKINFRANALYLLEWNQYCQLQDLNLMILAPYYRQRLILQGKHVADAANFAASHGGKNRYEYENGISKH